ncbi:MAG: hypothetical protein Q6373_009160 [Candidatus Sigynarchaeota archaeon]
MIVNGTVRPDHVTWQLARAVLAESRFKEGTHGKPGSPGGNTASIALACVTATAGALVLALGNNFVAFLGIQAAFLTLLAISAAGQARKPCIRSFLSSMPLPTRTVERSIGGAITMATAIPSATFPVLAAIALSITQPGAAYCILAVVSSILVAALPAGLSQVLALAVIKLNPKAPGRDVQETMIRIWPSSPAWNIGRSLMEVLFKDARNLATLLAPVVATAAIILAGFSVQVSDPVFAFFWLYILTGFLPFFISSAVSGAGDGIAPCFLALPRFTRRLLAAKQAVSGALFLAILAASTAIIACRVADPAQFLLLAAGLPLVGWFSCSITLLALDAVGLVLHTHRHFIVMILAFNIFGSMFWNLSIIEPLGAAITTALMIALGLASVVLLEALKRLAYRFTA